MAGKVDDLLDAARAVLDCGLNVHEEDSHYCLMCGLNNLPPGGEHGPDCEAIALERAVEAFG